MSEPTRGEVTLYVNADDDFVGVGIHLGDNRVVVIKPDGTLLPEGTSTNGLLARTLGAESPNFLCHVGRMGDCLMTGFERAPNGYTTNMTVTIHTFATPVVTSVDAPKENK
jgi:hypothetical protein